MIAIGRGLVQAGKRPTPMREGRRVIRYRFGLGPLLFVFALHGQAGLLVARTFPISTNTRKKKRMRTTRQEALQDEVTEQAKGNVRPARQWTWKRRGQGFLTVLVICQETR